MNDFKDHIRHVEGLELIIDARTLDFTGVSGCCILSGTDGKGTLCKVPIDEKLFSKHMLLLGNIGTGKTNAISQIMTQIKSQLTDDDVLVIFDTKGDYYTSFYEEGDTVISNDTGSFTENSDYWNIFSEITIDKTERSIRENALEIANNLFADKIKNTNQPFFPQAAKDILASFLTDCALYYDPEANNNYNLINFLETKSKGELLAFFEGGGEEEQESNVNTFEEESNQSEEMSSFENMNEKTENHSIAGEYQSILEDSDNNLDTEISADAGTMLSTRPRNNRIASYISKEASSQAEGVLSELYQLLTEIFVGDFRNAGNLSIRELIRNKGGKTIFIEYDITIGSVLAPIYRLLFDLAIKEAMGKKRSKGNVWFVIDEFSLIPNLLHIDSGINFGRSQGLKFIIGAQNIPQIYKAYGEHAAESLLSGLSTTVSFRIDDKKSRDFVQNRYGESLKKLIYKKAAQVAQGQIAEEIRREKVISDWDISNLKVGESIIGMPNMNPFLFRFEEFKK